MEIVLGKLKMPNSLICNAIIGCDFKILNPTVLDAIEGICPGDEEVKEVKAFTGNRSMLAAPEAFVDSIKDVPGFAVRLKAFKFINTYEEIFNDVETKH